MNKIKVEKAPFGVFTAESNKYIFVTNVQSNSISLIDKKNLKLEKNIKVGSWPYQVAFDNINKRAFVSNQRSNSISVIDLNIHENVKTLNDICEYPEGIDISYDENLVVIACWFEDNVVLLDLNDFKLINRIEMSGGPRAFGNFILD